MATILKIPTEKTKGVFVLTTQERDNFILLDDILRKKIETMKEKWLIGLHHNRHDYEFDYNPIFDFSMAGETDLIEKNGKKFSLLPMDACNFVPKFFRPGKSEKFWDILYVARAVKFKKIPEFFQFVRKAFDRGKKYRILFICPVPPFKEEDKKSVFYKIREVYEKTFNPEERKLFVLLDIHADYPFPFDLETLAHFYKSSKIFVHFANDERRCRVAAYAWASGLPVVGMECIGSLLPKNLKTKPYFYEIRDYKEFEKNIDEALANINNYNSSEVEEYFDLANSIERLEIELQKIFKEKNLIFNESKTFNKNLDIRLGRHHGLSSGENRVDIPFEILIEILNQEENIKKIDVSWTDPERKLCQKI